MDGHRTRIIGLLRLGAIGGLLFAALMGLMMAGFATDAPGSSYFIAVLIGASFFAAFSIPAVGLPLWAAWLIRQHGNLGLLPAAIFAILSILVFPIGAVIGVRILIMIKGAMRNQ